MLDGVNSLAIGMIKSCNSPLVVAGGNCTLQGFDSNGEDKFWTVSFYYAVFLLCYVF